MSKSINIGIACEGEKDLLVVQIILQRILDPVGVEFVVEDTLKAQTGIMGYVTTYARRFDIKGIKMAIFMTDQDISGDQRKNKIEQAVAKANPSYLSRVVIALPNPHMERWLIADQDNFKAIFRLDGDRPLPANHLDPKDRLEYIRSSMSTPQLGSYEVYEALAKAIDLDKVAAECPEFEDFRKQLIRVAEAC